MDSRIAYVNSTRTDEELLERVDNRQKYLPETTEAAVAELTRRGHTFTDEELTVIDQDMQAQRNNAALVGSRVSLYSKEYKNVIVNDPDAALMYSRLALYFFTLFMGAFFGSVMMAMNIAKTENRGKALWAVLFGVAFTAVQITIMESIKNPSSSYSILFGAASAYCLDYFFWRQFIGYATFYRARPIWVPLIIALVLAGLIMLSIIYAG